MPKSPKLPKIGKLKGEPIARYSYNTNDTDQCESTTSLVARRACQVVLAGSGGFRGSRVPETRVKPPANQFLITDYIGTDDVGKGKGLVL